MTNERSYDPFLGFKTISEMWEKQLNGMLYMMTDNKEFVRLAKTGLDTHSRYMERFRRNQEIVAGLMNIPTKKDVANAAKLTIQAEEKIDVLEEQIWNLQDSMGLQSKENFAMFQEMIKTVKELKEDSQKAAQDAAEVKKLASQLTDLKQEIASLKGLMEKEIPKPKGKDKELVTTK